MKAFLITVLSSMITILSVSTQTDSTLNVRGTGKDVAGKPNIETSILLQGRTSSVKRITMGIFPFKTETA